MTRRFQFSLARLLGAMALLSVAGAFAGALVRSIPSDSAPVMLGMACACAGAAIGLVLGNRGLVAAAFGAVIGLIAAGLILSASMRAVE